MCGCYLWLKMSNRSPLRYPVGKTRACKVLENIIEKYLKLDQINTIISPFFGGGSFEFYLQNKYHMNIIGNDKFKPLFSFWNICKNDKDSLCDLLYNTDTIDIDTFTE